MTLATKTDGMSPVLKTPASIRLEFESRGLSLSEWARAKGFSVALVYQVMSGQKRGLRGQSHQIAVALGLKDGVIGDLSEIDPTIQKETKHQEN